VFDVVCIGAATEDIFFFSDKFEVSDKKLLLPWKEKFTAGGLERRLGGGAFNASVAFSRLGLKSAFFGRVGTDPAGRAIKEFLEKEHVSTKFLVSASEIKTSTSMLLSSGGERTIVMYRGENDNLLEAKPDWDRVLNCRWIFLTDLAGTNNDLLFEIAKRTEQKGVKLAYVPGQKELQLGKDKLKPVLATAEILVLNSYEAETILGEQKEVERLLVEFKKFGVEFPVITVGQDGAYAYDGKKFYHQESIPKVTVVDRTGAGDAFSSTFSAGIILGKTISESLLLAAKNASSVITKIGGTDGLLTLQALKDFG